MDKNHAGVHRASEEALHAALDFLREGITVTDLDGRIVQVNMGAVRLHGCDRKEEMIGRSMFDFIAPEDRPRAVEDMQRARRDGRIERVDYRLLARDGRTFDGRLNAYLLRDGEGNPSGFIAIIRDVTARKRREAWLRKLERAVEQSPASVMIADPQGNLEYVNPKFTELTGYTFEEVLGENPRILKSGETPPEEYERLWATITSGREWRGEFHNRKKNGDLYWESALISPLKDADGNITHFIGIKKDITERKRAEEALRAREAELDRLARQQQALLRISQAVQEMVRPSDLAQVMQTCLEEVKRMGVDAQTIALHRVIDEDRKAVETVRVGPEGVLSVLERLERTGLFECWRTGRARREDDIEKRSPESVAQFRGRFRGIPIRSCLDVPFAQGVISVHSPHVNPFGEQDEEILKQVAEILSIGIFRAEDLEHQDALVRHLPNGVCLLDSRHRLVLANLRAEEYLRVLGGEPTGNDTFRIAGLSVEDLIAATESGMPCEVEVEGPPHRTFKIETYVVRQEAKNSGAVAVIRDVTREREVQERAQTQARLAAVGQLAAGVAHDFNNLLTVIVGLAQMLAQEELPAHVRSDLETIFQQGQRASRLTRQLLDFSRETEAERRPVDLVPFLKESMKLLQRTLPEHIAIETDFEGGHFVVEADLTQLQQVMTNLALNAQDAMPGGGMLTIGLSSSPVPRGERTPLPDVEVGNWIVWTVSDTGTGMPPEVLARIFEPFFTTKAPGEGTGLGLAQVYGIVKQHGGEIHVESREDEGTTFTIYLPEFKREEASVAPAAPELPRDRGGTILLVEDEEVVRVTTKAMLEYLNYRVLAVADGCEALEIYARHRDEIALVMADMVMPEMGGLELLDALRDMQADVPVVVMTGYATDEVVEKSDIRGTVAWMRKPLGLYEVAQVMDDMLRQRG